MSAAPPIATADDLRFCREVLPRVSRTFSINIRLLSGPFADAVRLAYLVCRAADALEDSWPGTAAEIEARFERFRAAIAGDGAAAAALGAEAAALPGANHELALVARFESVWRVFRSLPAGDRDAVADCANVMARGMSRYAARAAARGPGAAYLDDEGELHDYCWVVAGCVGVMLTRIFTARAGAPGLREEAKRLELAPVVGEALQLTNILLDWPVDVRRGRCYVPQGWLDEHGLAPADLVGRDDPRVRAIEARLEALARRALARVPDYLERLPRRALRYRLFVLLPALWALRSLEHAGRDPRFPWGESRPKLPRAALWSAGAAALLESGAAAELRGCLAPGATRAAEATA